MRIQSRQPPHPPRRWAPVGRNHDPERRRYLSPDEYEALQPAEKIFLSTKPLGAEPPGSGRHQLANTTPDDLAPSNPVTGNGHPQSAQGTDEQGQRHCLGPSVLPHFESIASVQGCANSQFRGERGVKSDAYTVGHEGLSKEDQVWRASPRVLGSLLSKGHARSEWR